RRTSFCVREPLPLHALARLKLEAGDAPWVRSGWARLFRFCLAMATRGYERGEAVIVKLDARALFEDLLSERPGSRAVFVHSTPEDFLASVLKAPERRLWCRRQLQLHLRFLGSLEGVRDVTDAFTGGGDRDSDGLIIVAFWLYLVRHYRGLLEGRF